MQRVTSTEFRKRFAHYRTLAHNAPLTITCRDRDELVVLSVAEYARHRRLDRQSICAQELPEGVADELGGVPIPAEASNFDSEYETKWK